MNPYVARIVGALPENETSLFPNVDFPEPKIVKPTVSATLPAPTDTAATVNPTPYIKTTRAGVNLSSTELEGGAMDPGQLASANNMVGALTKEQIDNYIKGTTYLNKSISSFANGYTANLSYKMQANNKEFQAKQNERSARLLLLNQREINRAAQADANVYRLQGVTTKSNQKVAMAQSGFAVGKGIYRNTLDTTDARTNYNTSAIILRAELENAELTRRAGLYEAEGIINRADASIARRQGKAALWDGVLDGIAYLGVSAAYFYVGANGYGGSSGSNIQKTKMGPDGTSAWVVNGKTMYGAS